MPEKHAEPKQSKRGQKAIEVLGDRRYTFELYRWREALMCFQRLIWAGKHDLSPCKMYPRGFLGQVRIRFELDQEALYPEISPRLNIFFHEPSGKYSATGITTRIPQLPSGPCIYCPDDPPPTRGDVESALAQFVHNHKLASLILPMTDPSHVQQVIFVNDRGGLRAYGSRK